MILVAPATKLMVIFPSDALPLRGGARQSAGNGVFWGHNQFADTFSLSSHIPAAIYGIGRLANAPIFCDMDAPPHIPETFGTPFVTERHEVSCLCFVTKDRTKS